MNNNDEIKNEENQRVSLHDVIGILKSDVSKQIFDIEEARDIARKHVAEQYAEKFCKRSKPFNDGEHEGKE